MPGFETLAQRRHVLEALFPKIINSRSAHEQENLFELTRALIAQHMADEEKIFYDMINRKVSSLKLAVTRAKIGHSEIRDYFTTLSRSNLNYEEWVFTLGELNHAFICHMELEKELMALAKKALKAGEFSTLSKRMHEAEKKIFAGLVDVWGRFEAA
jgi:hypothetical protein